jgi:hypothetical protein
MGRRLGAQTSKRAQLKTEDKFLQKGIDLNSKNQHGANHFVQANPGRTLLS